MTHVVPSRLLRIALAWDAAASGTLALLQIMQPHLAARLFGLTFELLIASGVVLTVHAALLFWMTSSPTVARWLVWLTIGGNIAWAMGCTGLCLQSAAPASLGLVYLLLQAIAVLAFAVAHAVGLHRSISVSGPNVKLGLRNTL